jgi:hypothetical protein
MNARLPILAGLVGAALVVGARRARHGSWLEGSRIRAPRDSPALDGRDAFAPNRAERLFPGSAGAAAGRDAATRAGPDVSRRG